MKHVVQTSILSTRWRYVWKSLPFLNFNSDLFYSVLPEIETDFTEFVDKVLLFRDRSSNIQRLNLFSSRIFDITCHLRSWILTALKQNVQELYLNITIGEDFQFPLSLFTCKSLKVLNLKYSGHSLMFSLPDSMSLPSLETLAFIGVLFEGDDISNKIFSSCPNLESLTITNCQFDDQVGFDISSLKLKHFVIKDCYDFCGLKLYAPNLISIRVGNYVLDDYHFENLSALVKAEINMNHAAHGKNLQLHEQRKEMYDEGMIKFLTALQNVKTLTLSGWFLQVISGAPALLDCTSIQFCNLRRLKLGTWLSRDCVHAITYLLDSSPNIESLLVEIKVNLYKLDLIYPYWDEVRFDKIKIEEYWEAGLSLRCNLYHLKYVEIRGVQGCLNELMFLEILLKNSMVLEKVLLFTCTEQSPHTKRRLIKFSEQLLTLPSLSSKIAILLL